MDTSMLKGIATGALGTILVGALLFAFGSLHPRSTSHIECVCSDSAKIESPRGLFPR